MTGLTLPTSLPLRPASARPPLAVAPAAITPAEADRIADSFPERPAVVQKLYGAGRQIQEPAVLGAHIDLSA